MLFKDKLRWSIRHCRKRFFESLLIVLAIGLGVAVIVSVSSLFINALEQQRNFNVHQYEFYRTFRVQSGANYYAMSNVPLEVVSDRPQERLEVTLIDLKEFKTYLPEGMYVYLENTTSLPTRLIPKNEENKSPNSTTTNTAMGVRYQIGQIPSEYESIYVVGSTIDYLAFKQFELATGNWFVEADIMNKNPVMVLNHKLATRLFEDENPIGQFVPVGWNSETEVQYQVIGVLAPLSEEQEQFSFTEREEAGYVPITAMQGWINRPSGFVTDIFNIGVEPGYDLAKAYEKIKDEVQLHFGDAALVTGTYVSSQAGDQEMFNKIAIIFGIFASIGLVIAVINILNLMLARVLKRTKAVGLSIALGGSKATVFSQFLIEAMVLGLTGSIVGVTLSYGLMTLIGRISPIKIEVGISGVLIGFGLGLLVSLLFGIYPAYQGSQIDPVDALRTD